MVRIWLAVQLSACWHFMNDDEVFYQKILGYVLVSLSLPPHSVFVTTINLLGFASPVGHSQSVNPGLLVPQVRGSIFQLSLAT